jgi:hypothetical protein
MTRIDRLEGKPSYSICAAGFAVQRTSKPPLFDEPVQFQFLALLAGRFDPVHSRRRNWEVLGHRVATFATGATS